MYFNAGVFLQVCVIECVWDLTGAGGCFRMFPCRSIRQLVGQQPNQTCVCWKRSGQVLRSTYSVLNLGGKNEQCFLSSQR